MTMGDLEVVPAPDRPDLLALADTPADSLAAPPDRQIYDASRDPALV
jgi:hypothetical protein